MTWIFTQGKELPSFQKRKNKNKHQQKTQQNKQQDFSKADKLFLGSYIEKLDEKNIFCPLDGNVIITVVETPRLLSC